jgi:hypothetical protein
MATDDHRAIEHLLYTYADTIDAGNFPGVADLFAKGRISAQADTDTPMIWEGRDAVLEMYQASTRLHDDGTPRTKHVTTNAIIEVDDAGDTAWARSYFTVLQQTDVIPLQPVIAGRYHDTFQRIDGVWWFDTRTMLVDLTGDLSQHLLYELS